MLIQFDREDSENLVLTFDNSETDVEQMQDFLAWLEVSGLDYSKLKMKIPGVAEKVTNFFVKPSMKTTKLIPNKVQEQTKPASKVQTKEFVPIEIVEEVIVDKVELVEKDDSSSESEEEEYEPVTRTKKTTKRVTNIRK